MTETPRRMGLGAVAASVRHLPNALTIARVALVVPAGWLLWIEAIPEALVIIAIAGVSDFVDGELARRFNWRTTFGAIADPAADKLLVLVVIVVLALQRHVPAWLPVVVVGRDLVIVIGALAYRLIVGKFEVEPTQLSKANTALLVFVLLVVIIGLMGDDYAVAAMVAGPIDPLGFVLVGVSSIVSGGQYVLLWSRRASVELRARNKGESA
ncbi:MAG: CDP-alcohol phosphatidyltransferase family protein [Gammaproteobacteria bacterium]|nr:CDP-alcohol phosphatidyltransferase family protein [Gammaproteobacteria bacterium]MXY55557.1 CDP-alcohol phosphatidyltransferase family protein [Gammaproteobacteria bacterium]MYK46522.1 CDP-alcohol phosphatidyltransferase family protein [Gammaproteobacteria bacterium]